MHMPLSLRFSLRLWWISKEMRTALKSRAMSEKILNAIRKVDIISAMVTNVQSHTLLESLFIYPYFNDYYGYLLLDKRTKQIVAIDCGDFKTCKYHVDKLVKQEKATFTHLFLTHSHEKHCAGYRDWQSALPTLHVASHSLPNTTHLHEGDLTYIGDLCVFPLHTPGHTPDSLSFVVTEVTPKSTLTPLVFPGDTLQIASCGPAADPPALYSSLQKLRSLPNETLIFPGHEIGLEALSFAALLEKENEFLGKKLAWAKDQRAQGQMTVGSVMGEERLYNPFLRCFQPHFKTLTNENDPIRVLAKLIKLRETLQPKVTN